MHLPRPLGLTIISFVAIVSGLALVVASLFVQSQVMAAIASFVGYNPRPIPYTAGFAAFLGIFLLGGWSLLEGWMVWRGVSAAKKGFQRLLIGGAGSFGALILVSVILGHGSGDLPRALLSSTAIYLMLAGAAFVYLRQPHVGAYFAAHVGLRDIPNPFYYLLIGFGVNFALSALQLGLATGATGYDPVLALVRSIAVSGAIFFGIFRSPYAGLAFGLSYVFSQYSILWLPWTILALPPPHYFPSAALASVSIGLFGFVPGWLLRKKSNLLGLLGGTLVAGGADLLMSFIAGFPPIPIPSVLALDFAGLNFLTSLFAASLVVGLAWSKIGGFYRVRAARPTPVAAPPSTMTCQSCGASLGPSARFCSGCGRQTSGANLYH